MASSQNDNAVGSTVVAVNNNSPSSKVDAVELDVIASRGHINPAFVTDTDTESQKLRDPESGDYPKPTQVRKKINWRAHLERRIYILSWIRSYDKSTAISDMIAGITLGLTMIPQAIAYAALAGLPSQYGLYSAFIGSLAYVVFGTIKQVSIGPTSLMALMTLQYTVDKPPEFAVILAFLAGCVELLMGIFNLGFIVSFISTPVTNAFTSATSLIIIGAQLKNLLGIKYSSKGFADSLYHLFLRIGDTQLGDGLLGIICCCFLLGFRKLTIIPVNTDSKRGEMIKKGIWYLSIARNAIIVLLASVAAYFWAAGNPPFKLSGKVAPGVPAFSLPPFEIEYKNHTAGFIEICSELGSAILVVPLVAVLANVAIAKAFTTGSVVDASQEMLTLGLCNLLGSCFKSMPTCGAFTRSAVSQASGVKTPMAGIYSGTMTILALSLLTPYFYFIPRATLASVLCCAVVFMIDIDLPVELWKKNRNDFYAWLGALIVCLAVGVEIGLLFGVLMNIVHLLYLWSRPKVIIKTVEIDHVTYLHVSPNIGMFFPGIDYLREVITKAAMDVGYKYPVVLDCSRFTGIDYTAAQGLNLVSSDIKKQKQIMIVLSLDTRLQAFTTSDSIIFCNKEEMLKEILTQENLRNGTIDLMQHIRDSMRKKSKGEALDTNNLSMDNNTNNFNKTQ